MLPGRWTFGATVLLLGVGVAFAQQTPDNSADRVAASPTPQPGDSWVVRRMRMLEAAPPGKRTAKERFDDYVRWAIGPAAIVGEGASAGVSQWLDSPKEWGQGGAGYGKRFANDMAYNIIRQTIVYGISEPLHEDTRYFASGQNSTGGRLKHALLSPVMARHSDGSDGFSYANTSGIVGANLIALAWAPPSWRGPGNFSESIAWSYAGTAAINVVREFMPDVIRHFRK